MAPHLFLFEIQVAAIALSVFVCIWGLHEFTGCLFKVLQGKRHLLHQHCPGQAVMAVLCLACLTFSFARANTIGFFPFGSIVAAMAYVGGTIVFSMVVGLALWAKERPRDPQTQLAMRPQSLAWVLSMMLIVIMAFLLVGLVGAMAP